MAWKIDRDYLEAPDSEHSRVGTGQGEVENGSIKLEGETFTFRCLDDDGEVYYHGVADAAAAENDEDEGGLYQANMWATADAGAIWLEVRAAAALKHGLTSRLYLEATGKNDTTDWVSIYA